MDAEIDRSALQAACIEAVLLDRDSSISEFGIAFQLRLQVPESQYDQAVALITSTHPERFGSVEKVNAEAKAVARGFRRYLATLLVTVVVLSTLVLVAGGPANALPVLLLVSPGLCLPIWFLYEFLRKYRKKD
jgi:hypothetical protein